ncbi:MAG: branched-chain amino acid ABC transporter permease [Actinomycetota bacterium]
MSTAAPTIEAPAVTGAPDRWRPDARGWAVRLGVIATLALGLTVLLAGLADFWADRVALAATYAIIGLSLNIVLGYTGQVSLGHHAFVGLGAFMSAYYVTERAGCSPEAGCVQTTMGAFATGFMLATLSGIISAGVLGLIALRIKGLYLALITLTYGFVAVNAIFEIPFLTRGGAGMPAPRPAAFASDHRYMTLCLLLLAVILFIDWRLLKSKVGRAILAVKESEAVAATYAVNVTMYKVLAFCLSGAIAGLAGALFAHRREIVVAVDFTFTIALLWVLMVVVGGLGNRTGVVIGSAFFALFPFLLTVFAPLAHFIEDTLGRDPEELTLMIGPALALLTIISFPGGIAEQISPITRWLSGNKFTMHPEGKQKSHKGGHGLAGKLRRKKPGSDSPESSEARVEPSGVTVRPASTTEDGDDTATDDDGATGELPAAVEEER